MLPSQRDPSAKQDVSEAGMAQKEENTSHNTVGALSVCLFILIVLLVILYKKLNRESKGAYTIQRMVFMEGGVRDRVRGVVLALESRLGVQVWSSTDENEFQEEMRVIEDEEEQAGHQCNEESDAEWHSKTEQQHSTYSDADSSLEDLESGERIRLTSESVRVEKEEEKEEEEEEEKEEEKEEEAGAAGGEGEAGGGTGLLIDLKQFSGSANWSSEEVGEFSDVTLL